MKRFVIQKHTRGTDVHWDLMLESDDNLQTWRIDIPPQDWIVGPMAAEKIFDHDKKFLTYEGPVNKDTGKVEIAEVGELKITLEKEDRIEFTLLGKILNGNFTLGKKDCGQWNLGIKSHQ